MEHVGPDVGFALPGLIMVFGGILALAFLALWIWALVDCIQRQFPGENDKLVWILVIVLVGWLGAIIYLIVGRPKGWKPGEQPPAQQPPVPPPSATSPPPRM